MKVMNTDIIIPQKQYSAEPHCRARFIVMIEVCFIHFSWGDSIWFNSQFNFDLVDLKAAFSRNPFHLFLGMKPIHPPELKLHRNKMYSHRGSHFGWTFPCDLAPTLLLWWLTFINKYNILIPFGGVHEEGKGSKQKDL